MNDHDIVWAMAGEAILVLRQNGIDIAAPYEGSLDDLERERWCGLLKAFYAALNGLRAAGVAVVSSDPTPEMVAKGGEAVQALFVFDLENESAVATAAYRAMIAANDSTRA